MMTPNRIFFALFLVACAAFAVFIIIFKTQKSPMKEINSFEECAGAGYPVMESYPRQCVLPDGRLFVEQIVGREQGRMPK